MVFRILGIALTAAVASVVVIVIITTIFFIATTNFTSHMYWDQQVAKKPAGICLQKY